MVKLSAGEKKRALILSTSKSLFYKKGYENTTIADICAAADTSPGSVTYHFPNKLDIAQTISVEFHAKVNEYITLRYGIDRDQEMLYSALQFKCWWEIMFRDPHIRVFYRDYSALLKPDLNALNDEIMSHIAGKHVAEDPKRLKMISALTVGRSSALQRLICDEPDCFTADDLYRFDYTITNAQYDISADECAPYMEIADSMMREKPLDIRYFRAFKYNKRYL